MILIHTTSNIAWFAHNGACLLDADEAPRATYGEHRFEVTIADDLVIEDIEVSREDIDANEWPGDRKSDRALYEARGVDVLRYEDMDASGRGHTTWRLVSARAVASTAARLITSDLDAP